MEKKMADYWAKIYIEIIDDPKMATLPDRLWRRILELFLLAKKFNDGGKLPDTKQIAWMLRMSTDELDLDMKQISSTKIIIQTETGWFIPNFEKRQAAATNTERVQQFRKRQQNEQYYGNVTEMKRNVTQINRVQNTESETETEPSAADIYKAYQNNIGELSGIISEKIDADINDYSASWVLEAIQKATILEKRSLAYVEGILKGWKRNGKNAAKPGELKYENVKVYDE
jgi:DnaD/phage-associated family protein